MTDITIKLSIKTNEGKQTIGYSINDTDATGDNIQENYGKTFLDDLTEVLTNNPSFNEIYTKNKPSNIQYIRDSLPADRGIATGIKDSLYKDRGIASGIKDSLYKDRGIVTGVKNYFKKTGGKTISKKQSGLNKTKKLYRK